jgi:hypothetical protein
MRIIASCLLVAASLAGCARSEPADTKVARNDIDKAPIAANVDSAIDQAVPSFNEAAVADAIRKKVADSGAFADTAKWMIAHTDLNGDGVDEAVAYVVDPGYCGTGGCSLYILGQQNGAWSVTDVIGPSRLPIYRLDPGSDGWASLGVSVGGGGIEGGVMSVPHDSKGYADNPTVAPAAPAQVGAQEPIIPDEDGTPLPPATTKAAPTGG